MRLYISIFILAGTLALSGCAPVWIMNPPEYPEPATTPVYRPVDWDHILLSERIQDKLMFKDKVVFVAEIGTSSKEYGVFWSDLDGKNLRKLYAAKYEKPTIKKIESNANNKCLIYNTPEFVVGYCTLAFLDPSRGEVEKEITNVRVYAVSPDAKALIFQEGWVDHFNLYIAELDENLLPKEKRPFLISPISSKYGLGPELVEGLDWTHEGVILATSQEVKDWVSGYYKINRKYVVSPDGGNLRKISEINGSRYMAH